jgi:hypothetical protein
MTVTFPAPLKMIVEIDVAIFDSVSKLAAHKYSLEHQSFHTSMAVHQNNVEGIALAFAQYVVSTGDI